ncbi:unnamed protein product [Candidula unifasciata]|uniref:Uncharacterized protein n=1 Tax=Candidula unifasciata TaxID=100452 RepID=A0A8S3ZBL7_9EUPU|nr:unnamed protein product [Candidula unifasciata]
MNKQSDCQMNMILEEIEKIKSFLNSELPSRIVSHPEWAAIFEKKSYVKAGDGIFNQAGPNRSDYSTDESSHLDKYGRNKHWCSVSDGDMLACVEESSTEQVQTIILMLSLYVLMLLTGCSPILSSSEPKEATQLTGCNSTIRERTLSTSRPREATPFLSSDDTAGETKRGKTKGKLAQQEKDLSRHLTDEHLQFMFGHHKEANYLCDLNHSILSSGEEVCLKLKDIAPGYNLQLKALISESKNLNFLIQAISGPQDDKLLWPATFSISLILVNKRPLATSKPNNWHSFTKSKSLFKPNKMIGQSTAIPLCYFRDDVLNNFIYDDTLTLKVSVNYVRKEEDPDDPQDWFLPGE